MNELNSAMRNALVQIGSSMTEATGKAGLPVLPEDEAAKIVGAPLSDALLAAVEHAKKLEEGPLTYTAANGQLVRVDRGRIVASAAAASEARQRLAAIEVVMATQPCRKDLAVWLFQLSTSVERAPSEAELDLAVARLTADLQNEPAFLFTNLNRRNVAREIVWWPSYAKLANALEKLKAPLVAEQKRLQAVVAAAAAASTSPTTSVQPARVRKRQAAKARRKVRTTVQELDSVALGRKGKRWMPLPIAPVRSVKEQFDDLKGWNWSKPVVHNEP